MISLLQHAVTARAAWLPLLLAPSACNLDLPLGDLSEDDGSLVDEGSGASRGVAASGVDGHVPAQLPAPGLSTGMGDEPQYSASAAIDLDGDGLDDLVLVAHDGATGMKYLSVRYGAPRPRDAIDAFAFRESGAKLVFAGADDVYTEPSGLFPAGDVNGDGFADLFLVTQVIRPARPNSGGYLIYGSPERFEGTFDMATVGARFSPAGLFDDDAIDGYTFAGGDFDGDGFSDLALALPGRITRALIGVTAGDAGIYIFYGHAERFAATTPWADADARLSSALSGDPAREADRIRVSAAGDLDGDARADLVVDFAARDGSDQRLILVPGSARRLTGVTDLLAVPTQLAGATLRRLADVCTTAVGQTAIGDLDGDGLDDLVAWLADAAVPSLFYGAPDFLAGPLDAARAAARLGRQLDPLLPVEALLPLGDLDGDGDAEIGAPRRLLGLDGGPYGAYGCDMAVLSGTRERLSGDFPAWNEPDMASTRLYPDPYPNFHRYAQFVSPVGDVDGDGASDVMTLSVMLWDNTNPADADPTPMLHIHYGVPAVGSVDGPR